MESLDLNELNAGLFWGVHVLCDFRFVYEQTWICIYILTHWGALRFLYASINLINNGSYNCLWPDCTKPLLEPMLSQPWSSCGSHYRAIQLSTKFRYSILYKLWLGVGDSWADTSDRYGQAQVFISSAPHLGWLFQLRIMGGMLNKCLMCGEHQLLLTSLYAVPEDT